MALDFPSNPTNGQLFDDYFYDASIGAWRGIGSPNNLGDQVGQLRTASPITVANQAARDSLIPAPVQGNSVYRTDLGVTQTYYGLFNASTNPGGRDVAGWYDTEKSIGLVPVQPTSAVITGGSGSANSLGVINFTNATSVRINNVFSSQYRNYRLLVNVTRTNAVSSGIGFLRLTTGGAVSTISYIGGYTAFHSGGSGTITGTGGADGIYFSPVYYPLNTLQMDIFNPNEAIVTKFSGIGFGSVIASGTYSITGGSHEQNASFDGAEVLWNAGTWSGTIQVFGYND